MSLVPGPVSGFVLAGGRSSRMGRDKALLELAGKPLIAHAVDKLHALCAEVAILGSNPALNACAPLVPDIHPGCGPLGGIEAALARAQHDWSLILPVDVPFLPSAFLASWIQSTLHPPGAQPRASIFTVDGMPTPTVLLIHRDLAPYIAAAVAGRQLKLLSVLESACRDLEHHRREPPGTLFSNTVLDETSVSSLPGYLSPTFWFSNLNTLEDLVAAEKHALALRG